MQIAVIGGGAAGFFSAIAAKERYPNAEVSLYEKSSKVLAKVKISGGGRCNVTNACRDIDELAKAYPRGQKLLRRAFHRWNTQHTIDWFEQRDVPLVTQEDNCIFPEAQDSQVVIDCFWREIKRLGITVKTGYGVAKLLPKGEQYEIHFKKGQESEVVDKVIVATGGSPKRSGLTWLEELGHRIEDPVPSLFTFNMPDEPIRELMGLVVEETQTSIQGTKLQGDGPLLITHWGMSGPAILKLSAFGARILEEMNYQCTAQVNWVNERNTQTIFEQLQRVQKSHPHKNLANYRPFGLPKRLWFYLLAKNDLPEDKPWIELGKKSLHKLTHSLTSDTYQVRGKTTFKEEFVTCGGVSLKSINPKTMESKVCPGLFFAGEVLDIDGITGGYNFQAAWTTAYIAGQLGH